MLVGTTALIPLGTIIFLGVEWANPKRLALYLYGTRSWHLCFNRLHLVTAGIATVDYNDLHPITLFITIILCLLGQVLTLQGRC